MSKQNGPLAVASAFSPGSLIAVIMMTGKGEARDASNRLSSNTLIPGMTGVELYACLIEAGHKIPTILVTAYPDISSSPSWPIACTPLWRGGCMALAPGLSPRSVIEKFAAMQMIDVHVPTTNGRELLLTRYTEPDAELRLLLDKPNSRCRRSRHPKSPPRRLLRNSRRSEDL